MIDAYPRLQRSWLKKRCCNNLQQFDEKIDFTWNYAPHCTLFVKYITCRPSFLLVCLYACFPQGWVESHFSDSKSAPVSGSNTPVPAPTPINFKTSLCLLLTLCKLQKNSYQNYSAYFASWEKLYTVAILPLIKQKWLKWQCYIVTQGHNKNEFIGVC